MHGQTTSSVACHHRLWTTHTVGKVGIAAIGQHAWSDYVEHGMTSPPLDSTHGRTTSGVEFHHRLWAAHTVERRRAWHYNTAFGQHTRSKDVGRGMPSSLLGSTHGRTSSGVACHHSPWMANTVERPQAWHAIIAFEQHKQSNDVKRGMPS